MRYVGRGGLKLEEAIRSFNLNVKDKSAIDMVRKRIGNVAIVNDEMLSYIFNRSGRNPREFLENCEDILKLACSKGVKKIMEKHVDEALTSEIIKSENN